MTFKKSIPALLVLLTLTQALRAGGPWAEGKGKGYVEASAMFNLLTDNTDHSYQLYSEVGVTDKITLKLVLPFKYVGSPEDLDVSMFQKGKLFGISNINIGAKYEFLNKKVLLSAGMDIELRTINAFDEYGLRTGYEKSTFRPIFSAGGSTELMYMYGEIRPGFSTNGYGHEFGFITEIGGKVDENVWLAAYFEIRSVFKNGDFNERDAPSYAATGFFRDEQNFFTAGVKFMAYLHKGFGMNAGVFYGSGINQPEGGKGSLGVKTGLFYDW